ncbi:MAG: hypothetical protein DRJ44_02940 [Thermoprotei archaeon]|nr:MAG: hypothetical protein DRJ44_02940 [Thermoprotei archaeon]
MRGYVIDIFCATIIAVLFVSAVLFSKDKYSHLFRVQNMLECQYIKEKIARRLLRNPLEKDGEIVIDSFLCRWASSSKIRCYNTNTNSMNFTVNSKLLYYDDGEVKTVEVIVVCGNEG